MYRKIRTKSNGRGSITERKTQYDNWAKKLNNLEGRNNFTSKTIGNYIKDKNEIKFPDLYNRSKSKNIAKQNITEPIRFKVNLERIQIKKVLNQYVPPVDEMTIEKPDNTTQIKHDILDNLKYYYKEIISSISEKGLLELNELIKSQNPESNITNNETDQILRKDQIKTNMEKYAQKPFDMVKPTSSNQ